MPPPPRRRNADYLNRPNLRIGELDRDLNGQVLILEPDLRLISEARSNGASDLLTMTLPTWTNCFT